MNQAETPNDLEVAVRLARVMSKMAMWGLAQETVRTPYHKRTSGPITAAIVTAADTEIERWCRHLLHLWRPNDLVYGEEFGQLGFPLPRNPHHIDLNHQGPHYHQEPRRRQQQGTIFSQASFAATQYGGEKLGVGMGKASRSVAREVIKPISPRRLWTVDPIDGTWGYMQGMENGWGILLTLEEDGVVILAVIAVPYLDGYQLNFAILNGGAYSCGIEFPSYSAPIIQRHNPWNDINSLDRLHQLANARSGEMSSLLGGVSLLVVDDIDGASDRGVRRLANKLGCEPRVVGNAGAHVLAASGAAIIAVSVGGEAHDRKAPSLFSREANARYMVVGEGRRGRAKRNGGRFAVTAPHGLAEEVITIMMGRELGYVISTS